MAYLTCTQSKALARSLDAMRRQALTSLWLSAPSACPRPGSAQQRQARPGADGPARDDDIQLARIEDHHRHLSDIEQAQGRLASGRYGVCIACSERIPAARMRSHPLAIRCAACQAAFDARSR